MADGYELTSDPCVFQSATQPMGRTTGDSRTRPACMVVNPVCSGMKPSSTLTTPSNIPMERAVWEVTTTAGESRFPASDPSTVLPAGGETSLVLPEF